jgi:FMN reductase
MTTSSTIRTIAVISAGLSQPSSTRLLADRLAEATGEQAFAAGIELRVVTIELRELAHDITNNVLTGFPSEALAAAIETVTNADGLIAVTPVFSASYSGLFKSFFDVLEPELLQDKPTLIAATGGSSRHSLVLEYALRPLMNYLRARTAPTAVFAATSDFGTDTAGASLSGRIARAAGELVSMLAGTPTPPKVDPFDLPFSFAELLHQR